MRGQVCRLPEREQGGARSAAPSKTDERAKGPGPGERIGQDADDRLSLGGGERRPETPLLSPCFSVLVPRTARGGTGAAPVRVPAGAQRER